MVNKQKPHAPPGPRQDPRAKSQRSCICLFKKNKTNKNTEPVSSWTALNPTQTRFSQGPLAHWGPDQGSSHPWPYGERERERRGPWICSGRSAQSLLHGTPQEMRDYSVFLRSLWNILVYLAYMEASHKRNEEKCMLTTCLRVFTSWLIQSGSVMSTDKAGVRLPQCPRIWVLLSNMQRRKTTRAGQYRTNSIPPLMRF